MNEDFRALITTLIDCYPAAFVSLGESPSLLKTVCRGRDAFKYRHTLKAAKWWEGDSDSVQLYTREKTHD